MLVQTVAGIGRAGYFDGPVERATFSSPHCCLPLPDGSLLVSDHVNDCLRRVHAKRRGVEVETIGGDRRSGGLLRPRGIALMPDGSVLVCDSGHNRIRRLSLLDGQLSTFAGTGRRGHRDGAALLAEFDCPSGISLSSDGVVLVCDSGNRCIRTLVAVPGRRVSVGTLVVTATGGHSDGSGNPLVNPSSVVAAAGSDGILYVSDAGSHTILAFCPSEGKISATVVAGSSGNPGLKVSA